MIPFAARTHPGLKRTNNEDSFVVEADLGLWVVADGVGGHSNGEVASAIACETILNCIRSHDTLELAMAKAHDAVLAEIERRGSDSNMGTTAVALRLSGDHYEIAWVGDSRAYVFEGTADGNLRQLTADHSAVNELVINGAITQQQASLHPQRHALSRSLGVSTKTASNASVVRGKLKRGQQLLLCTDGLTEELSDPSIARELRRHSNVDAQAEALLDGALANGGRDNITIVLVGRSSGAKPSQRRDNELETTQSIGQSLLADTGKKGLVDRQTLLLLLLLGIVATAALL